MVHHVLSTTIDLAAIALNLVLLYLILNHSNFRIVQFKWIFMMTCIGDLFLSTICLFSQPYLVFVDGYMSLTSNGPFCCRSEVLDHIAMTVFCVGLHVQIVIVVLQYVWRYTLVLKETSMITATKGKLVLPAVWCGVQAVTAVFCWNFDQSGLREHALDAFQAYGWQFTVETAPYPALTPVNGFKTRAHNVFYMASPVVGYAVIISCHVAVARFIRRHGAPSHKVTVRANKEVNRALIALALTPIVSLTSTATIIGSEWLEVPIGLHISGFLSLTMTLLAFTNPLVTILCVYSYRKGFLSLIRWRKAGLVAPSPIESNTIA